MSGEDVDVDVVVDVNVDIDIENPPVKRRRKVRKGTRSCWECRRRKIKCLYANESDAVCINCVAREAPCVSQEYAPEPQASTPGRGLAQRLEKLEALMMKKKKQQQQQRKQHQGQHQLTEAALQQTAFQPTAAQKPLSPGTSEHGSLNGGQPAVRTSSHLGGAAPTTTTTTVCSTTPGPYIVTCCPTPTEEPMHPTRRGSGSSNHHIPSIDSSDYGSAATSTIFRLSLARNHAAVSQHLHSLFPPQRTMYIIWQQSLGANYVRRALCENHEEPEPLRVLSAVPPPGSPPAVLARRLLQLSICLQQMPPFFNATTLGLARPPLETLETWVAAVTRLVASDDDLVDSLEGLQCLMLLAFYEADAGHLRRAWTAGRRGLMTAQLMGLHRNGVSGPGWARGGPRIRSVEPPAEPAMTTPNAAPGTIQQQQQQEQQQRQRQRPSAATAAGLWCRVNCIDRYLSLMLGLPVGNRDNSWASDPALAAVSEPKDKMAQMWAIISGKIADRNDLAGYGNGSDSGNSEEAWLLTQRIDLDLEQSHRVMGDAWWQLPSMASMCASSTPQDDGYCAAEGLEDVQMQVRHFVLVVLVHLPYLLRSREHPRYEYHRNSCMEASRRILERFLEFRTIFTSAMSGRYVDYSCLVAAMTLLLGHLGHSAEQHKQSHPQQQQHSSPSPPSPLSAPSCTSPLCSDRSLVESVRDKLRDIADLNDDRLCAESAKKIEQLLPIVQDDVSGPGCNTQPVHLNVPFMGAVQISPASATCSRVPASAAISIAMQHPTPPVQSFIGTEVYPNYETSQHSLPVEWALQGIDATYWSTLCPTVPFD